MLKPSLAGLRFNEGLSLRIPPFLPFHLLPLVWNQLLEAGLAPESSAVVTKSPSFGQNLIPGQKSSRGAVGLPGQGTKPGERGIFETGRKIWSNLRGLMLVLFPPA